MNSKLNCYDITYSAWIFDSGAISELFGEVVYAGLRIRPKQSKQAANNFPPRFFEFKHAELPVLFNSYQRNFALLSTTTISYEYHDD